MSKQKRIELAITRYLDSTGAHLSTRNVHGPSDEDLKEGLAEQIIDCLDDKWNLGRKINYLCTVHSLLSTGELPEKTLQPSNFIYWAYYQEVLSGKNSPDWSILPMKFLTETEL